MEQLTFNQNVNFKFCPPGGSKVYTRGTTLFSQVSRDQIYVDFKSGFWLAEKPVTFRLWEIVTGRALRNTDYDNNQPVFGLDYSEGLFFVDAFNAKFGTPDYFFELPNYLEWRYACSASLDPDQNFWQSASIAPLEYCWCLENSSGTVQPVGQKLPNNWGLYDMLGNVFEMCQDVNLKILSNLTCYAESRHHEQILIATGGYYNTPLTECLLMNTYNIEKSNIYAEPVGLRLICRKKS